MKVAALQLCSQDDVAANLAVAEKIVADAAYAGAGLILLPEAFAYLGPDSNKPVIAERLGTSAPIQDAIASWCKKHEIAIIAGGMAEWSDEPARPYNTSAVFDPQGKIVASYRKLHLFDVQLADGTSWAESRSTSPGHQAVIADIDDLHVGLSICYDLRFPELYTLLRSRGANLLTVPAAFTATTGRAHWEVLLRSRAIETQCWVMAAAQQGTHPRGRQTYGHSMIVDPWGKVVAERTEAGPGFAAAEIDLEEISSIREQMPVEKHRLGSLISG